MLITLGEHPPKTVRIRVSSRSNSSLEIKKTLKPIFMPKIENQAISCLKTVAGASFRNAKTLKNTSLISGF